MERQQAVNRIEWLYGDVYYDYQVEENGKRIPNPQPPDNSWMRHQLGDAWVSDVKRISLRDPYMRHGASKMAEWSGTGEGISDATVALVRRFPSIEHLSVVSNDVTDDGLGIISSSRTLRSLFVISRNVTDDGVARQSELQNLKSLYIVSGNVTDAGRKQLQTKIPDCKITFVSVLRRGDSLPISVTD
jgi:hypothetical protein